LPWQLIAFLASDKAGFITGDCVKIDGGRRAARTEPTRAASCALG